jgi:hypothetical protein
VQWLATSLIVGWTKEEYHNGTVAPGRLSISGKTLTHLLPSTDVSWSIKSPGGWKRKQCVTDLIDPGTETTHGIRKRNGQPRSQVLNFPQAVAL